MRKTHFPLLFFVLLAFGFGFAVPAQDLPETAYDESQAEPFEPAAVMSDPAPLIAVVSNRPAIMAQCPGPRLSAVISRRISQSPPHRFLSSRLILALMCSLIR